MSKPVSIYLVDDHAVVRNGLKALIERLGDYTITEQFDNGKELIDSIPFQTPPDIIIMDLTMPVMDGKETVKELKERNIATPVLMLTLESDERIIVELFRLGIRGYLPKSCTADVLRKAIEDVTQTGYYHNEILIKALSAPDKKDEPSTVRSQLTQREIEFVQYVCDEHEYTYDQIAGLMGVSRRTVDGYREEIFHKFDIKSKTGLVLLAIKYGIVNINQKQV
jgi:two-component system invasion response regulator UvrY